MIFRLDNGVENLLALTPVLAEWRARHGGPVMVDTDVPEVFRNNPYVDEAGKIGDAGGFFEMDFVAWGKLVRHVTETYALAVFGDCDLRSWRTFMGRSAADAAKARDMVPEGRTAAVCLDGKEMARDLADEVVLALLGAGYAVVDVGMEACGSLGVQREAIAAASVFVGTDGPAASVAFTTDVPAAVCYTWRNPCYFAPFRRGVPYEALCHKETDCDAGKVCLAMYGKSEMGKLYWHDCPAKDRYACREMDWAGMVGKALARMEDRA